ncbi:MAG TPA: FAD-dependent oxidoreductase [Gemmatimonadaceae bacterium]|nr:FAD-dependent oxidoreductase [Gemmatimonadaceae bacterium]
MANDTTPPRSLFDSNSSTPREPAGSGPLERRDFLKVAGAGAGLLLLGGCAPAVNPEVPGIHRTRRFPLIGRSSPDIIVIGAGAWGGWTALNLRQMGAKVTVVDAYGPGNARSTSGDESRGVRSSYGDRSTGEHWMLWAREAMKRWTAFDDTWGRDMRLGLFHTTGDLILRADWEPYLVNNKKWWDKHNIPYQALKPEDVRKLFPVISMDDINIVLYEPDAGVVRARRACQAVAAAFERLGGKIVIGRASPSKVTNGRLEEISLDTGQKLTAETFVYAPGPWMQKTFPELFAKNPMRTPLGYVCYYGTPVGDERFTYPNIPSFNFPGVTGWAALPVDNLGFRVRGGERAPGQTGGGGGGANAAPTPPAQLDPDTSDRWPDASHLDGPRRFVSHRFPLLKDAPLLATHSCHYEISPSGNFIVDRHPQRTNVWIAGGGNAEGFKFGPVIGEYVAQRVMGEEGSPAVAKAFKYDAPPDTTRRSRNGGANGAPAADSGRGAKSAAPGKGGAAKAGRGV